MTSKEAIDVLKKNYPDSCFELLREAVDMAIQALKSTKCESDVKIYPDGENELDPCEYELVEKRRNCTVEVLKCKKCGHVEIIWTDNDKFPEEVEE